MTTNVFDCIYNSESIGDKLVADGVISREQFKEAYDIQRLQGGFVGKILVEKGMVFEEELLSHFIDKYAISYVQPKDFPINTASKRFIPEELAREYLLLPVDNMGYRLTVICAGPLEGAILGHALEACNGTPVSFFISTISEIERALKEMYSNAD